MSLWRQMPIYEYQCGACDHRFEMKQGFDAETTQSCPLCNSASKRKFHSPTVIYKGSGFYTTDYARKNFNPEDRGSDSREKDTSSKDTSDTSSTEA